MQVGQELSDVHRAMTDGGFHHVPVVRGDKLVGIVSSTDLLRVSYEYGPDAHVTIEQLMKADPITLREDHQVRDAVEAFTSGVFHSLPVVDDEDTLVGLVTTTDVLRHVIEE